MRTKNARAEYLLQGRDWVCLVLRSSVLVQNTTFVETHLQDKLTQSSWCEEAGEDKQACGPHGLLFLPPAAEGPSQSVLAIVRSRCLFQGTLPSTLTLLTPGHESENLSGENRPVLLFTSKKEVITSSTNATDGRAAVFARSHAVLMALRLSRCHRATACKLLNLTSAQTHAGCDQPNTKQAQTAKCISGPSVVVRSSER